MAFRRTGQNVSPHPDEVRMTLGEHLEELRSRLIRAILAIVIGAGVCYLFIDLVQGFLLWPVFEMLKRHGYSKEMTYLNPAEPFITDLKVAAIVGVILSAPYSLVQIWGFIAAGLYPHERKWVRRFVPASIGLFFTGVAFLLIIVSPLLLHFFLSYKTELPDVGRFMPGWLLPGTEPPAMSVTDEEFDWPSDQGIPSVLEDPDDPPEGQPWLNRTKHQIRIRFGETNYDWGDLRPETDGNILTPAMRLAELIPLILRLAAAFGLGFQVPVVVVFLVVIGVTDAKEMAGLRRYVWFGMSIGAAVITPPDMASMLFLLLPMALLYEVGLLCARTLQPRF